MGGFYDKLRTGLEGELNENLLELLPRGFQRIGDIIIVNIHKELLPFRQSIGSNLLSTVPKCRSVCVKIGGISGKHRTPNLEVVAGDKNTETIHREHDCLFKLDVKRIMFAKGNISERRRLADLVRDGEVIVDMFAGIGYFSIIISRHANPKAIHAIELNPISYKYLCENILLNKVNEKIHPILGDCSIEAPKLATTADRILMGYLPSPRDYLPAAMNITKPNGTIIHYEGLMHKTDPPTVLLEEIEDVALDFGKIAKLRNWKFVKTFAPNVYHAVLDVLVEEG
ncbi:MAG: class I SAM-dependent methyltransferase family protein [Promethearchaeota archaeon]